MKSIITATLLALSFSSAGFAESAIQGSLSNVMSGAESLAPEKLKGTWIETDSVYVSNNLSRDEAIKDCNKHLQVLTLLSNNNVVIQGWCETPRYSFKCTYAYCQELHAQVLVVQ